MYKYLCLLSILFCLYFSPVQAGKADTCLHPLKYDTARINKYQQDSRFDYNSQLRVPEFNLWEYLAQGMSEWLRKTIGNKYAGILAKPLLIGICVFIIGLIIFFIYKKHPELFYREKKKPLLYQVSAGENIYEIDFEKEIQTFLSQKNYSMAVRLTYLQTLRHLADCQRINWQPSKTPTDYLYEIKGTSGKEEFRYLTTYFLKIRYGNFDAEDTLYNKVKECQARIFETKGETDEK